MCYVYTDYLQLRKSDEDKYSKSYYRIDNVVYTLDFDGISIILHQNKKETTHIM